MHPLNVNLLLFGSIDFDKETVYNIIVQYFSVFRLILKTQNVLIKPFRQRHSKILAGLTHPSPVRHTCNFLFLKQTLFSRLQSFHFHLLILLNLPDI